MPVQVGKRNVVLWYLGRERERGGMGEETKGDLIFQLADTEYTFVCTMHSILYIQLLKIDQNLTDLQQRASCDHVFELMRKARS